MMIALACRITLSLLIATTSSRSITAFLVSSSALSRHHGHHHHHHQHLVVGSNFYPVCRRLRFLVVASAKHNSNNDNSEQQSDTTVAAAAAAAVVLPQSVQVCKSKDCRRRGGAQRLLGQIQAIVQTEQWDIPIIESCDCLGECGYGPNLLIDGIHLVNNVRSEEAIRHALLSSRRPRPSTTTTTTRTVGRTHGCGLWRRKNFINFIIMIMMIVMVSSLQLSLAWSSSSSSTAASLLLCGHATMNPTMTTTTQRCYYHSYHNHWSIISSSLVRPTMTRLHDSGSSGDSSSAEEGSLLFGGEPHGVVYMPDLSWRVEKLRLEEQNRQRFLKALPRFLPYTECRKWVQAFGRRWQTKEDWREWIAMGEKRNSYIPSEPDEYYGRLGQWISWDHFLLEDTAAVATDNNDDDDADSYG